MKVKFSEKHLFLGAFVATFVKCLVNPGLLDLILASTCIIASAWFAFQEKRAERQHHDQFSVIHNMLTSLQKSQQDVMDRVTESRSNTTVQSAFKRF